MRWTETTAKGWAQEERKNYKQRKENWCHLTCHTQSKIKIR